MVRASGDRFCASCYYNPSQIAKSIRWPVQPHLRDALCASSSTQRVHARGHGSVFNTYTMPYTIHLKHDTRHRNWKVLSVTTLKPERLIQDIDP